MTDYNEAEILQHAIGGDKEAFSILYQNHVSRIYNYIFYRTGNELEAEDLTAKVFFRAMNHIKTYRNLGVPFAAWLYRIAHNLVANWRRDSARRQDVTLEEDIEMGSADLPETTLLQKIEQDHLLRAIRHLSSDRQQILILKYIDQLTNAEIAIVMRGS